MSLCSSWKSCPLNFIPPFMYFKVWVMPSPHSFCSSRLYILHTFLNSWYVQTCIPLKGCPRSTRFEILPGGFLLWALAIQHVKHWQILLQLKQHLLFKNDTYFRIYFICYLDVVCSCPDRMVHYAILCYVLLLSMTHVCIQGKMWNDYAAISFLGLILHIFWVWLLRSPCQNTITQWRRSPQEHYLVSTGTSQY